MSKEIKISNGYIDVVISTMGAEMKSITKNGKEMLWCGDPAVWPAQTPLMFPICGGLKDDKFIYNGKEYNLEKHGYGRKVEFELEKADNESATFLLVSNEESHKVYPFDYELRVTYTLDKTKVNIKYDVKNTTDGEMYFSIGGHEGYACPEGIEEYSVIFPETEDLVSNILNGNLLEHNTRNLGNGTKELQLKYEYFAIDAQVFLNLKSKKATLRHRATGEERTVYFDGFDFFLLWTKPGAKYICMEPWCGCQDFMDSDYDITKKRGIIKLEKGETCVKVHSIEV